MKLNFKEVKNGTGRVKVILDISDAKIIFRNFAGVGSKYNVEGNRNFAVLIPTKDIADKLVDAGWNVKIKPPREEGDDPFMYLPVKLKYRSGAGSNPAIYLKSGQAVTKLNESEVSCLDYAQLESVDMFLNPYDWEFGGKEGRTAYLESMWATQHVDPYASRYESFKNAGNDDYDEVPF